MGQAKLDCPKISNFKNSFLYITCLSVAKCTVFEKLSGDKTLNKCGVHAKKEGELQTQELFKVNLDIKLVIFWC